MTSGKPVVYYETLDGFYPFPDTADGEYAIILGVKNHPALGSTPWVRTSTVVRKTYGMDLTVKDPEEFATLNTVYKKRKNADVS
jgi:hypothetical protein